MLELFFEFVKLFLSFFAISFVVIAWWNFFDDHGSSYWQAIKYTAWHSLSPAAVLATVVFMFNHLYAMFD